MSDSGESDLRHLLRNTPVRELIRALERDGFLLRRNTSTGARIYRHPVDLRTAVIHYHHGGDILTPGVLASFLIGTRWTYDDAHRLGLL